MSAAFHEFQARIPVPRFLERVFLVIAWLPLQSTSMILEARISSIGIGKAVAACS